MRLIETFRPGIAEAIHSGMHECGLEILVNRKAGFSRQIAILGARFGSIDSVVRTAPEGTSAKGDHENLPQGLAHFLEHELFAKKSGDIGKRFARLGASANAATGFTSTSYFFSCTRALRENLELLGELVFDPYFCPATVRKERDVIAQELRMYEDCPDWRVYTNLLGSLFHRHPIRFDIAGTEASIESITPEVLERAYRTYYHPSNLILILTGDVDPDEIDGIVDSLIGSRTFGDALPIDRSIPHEPVEAVCDHRGERGDVAQPKVLVGYKDASPPNCGRAILEREVRRNLLVHLLFGSSSDLYQELYDDGLVDDSFGASYSIDRGAGLTVLGGDTDQPERLVEKLREGIASAQRSGIVESDFERTRRRLLGRFFFGFNSPESTASTLLSAWSKEVPVWEYPDVVAATTRDDMDHQLADAFSEASASVSTLLPATGGAGAPTPSFESGVAASRS